MVLGIETATDVGSVALVEDKVLYGEIQLNKRFSQSKFLVQSIEFLLNSLELKSQQLGGIAVSIGPGSYTGLRIGLSVAKALAFSWNIPLTAVNSLDAFAQKARGQSSLICPLIRFRKQEYYYGFYAWTGSEIERQSDYRIDGLSEIIFNLESSAVFFGILHSDDYQFFSEHEVRGKFLLLPEYVPSAFWIAYLGENNFRRGIIENTNQVTPFYMHEFPMKS